MEKTEFLTIYASFESLETVQQTLPSIVEETGRNDAKLIVHDSSVDNRTEKWAYLQELKEQTNFFLILSDNLSMAHARNMCLFLGQQLYAPDYICVIEDDHGFREGFIAAMIDAMRQYYGKISPNGLRYGLFTGCGTHHYAKRHILESGHGYPDIESPPGSLGGANSCCRCAPTAHWQNVLQGYDTDEYLISTYQTRNINFRNYHKGFTTLIVANGEQMFHMETDGRGSTAKTDLKVWDEEYTASDSRSVYLGKATPSIK